MGAENYCKAPIILLFIAAASAVAIADAFSQFSPGCQHVFPGIGKCPVSASSCAAAIVSPSHNHAAQIRPKTNTFMGSISRATSHALSSTTSGDSGIKGNNNDTDDDKPKTLRDKLRKITGFSMTTFRATLRGIIGFSLTALRASLRAATGVSVTATTKAIVGLFPLWLRYFMQPFLVLYYAPLMVIRSWVGETKTARAEQMAAHEKVVEGWKHAIEVAESAQASGYWPVHVDDDGNIVTKMPPEPNDVWTPELNEAVLESVEVADAMENE